MPLAVPNFGRRTALTSLFRDLLWFQYIIPSTNNQIDNIRMRRSPSFPADTHTHNTSPQEPAPGTTISSSSESTTITSSSSSSPSPPPTPFRFRTPSAFIGTLERGGPCSEAETEAVEGGVLDCVICGFVDDSPFHFPFPFADEEPRATSTSLANSVLFAFCHQTS
jgi:hypothetical protein